MSCGHLPAIPKAFCKTWHSLPLLKACLIKAAPWIFILGKQKLNRMKSNCSPSLHQDWLRKVLSNQINSVNTCLSDKLHSFPAGNIPLPPPQVSLSAALWQLRFAHGHKSFSVEGEEPRFLPHSPFMVPLVPGERRARGSWPSFLKCQAPWGGHSTSGGSPAAVGVTGK